MPANWQEVRIAAGATESADIPIPVDTLSCPPGRMRKADGAKFSGTERPRFNVIGAGPGSKIVLDEAATEEVVFQVKDDTD